MATDNTTETPSVQQLRNEMLTKRSLLVDEYLTYQHDVNQLTEELEPGPIGETRTLGSTYGTEGVTREGLQRTLVQQVLPAHLPHLPELKLSIKLEKGQEITSQEPEIAGDRLQFNPGKVANFDAIIDSWPPGRPATSTRSPGVVSRRPEIIFNAERSFRTP